MKGIDRDDLPHLRDLERGSFPIVIDFTSIGVILFPSTIYSLNL